MSDRFGHRIAPASNSRSDSGPELPNYLKSKRVQVSKAKAAVKPAAQKQRVAVAAASAPRPAGNSKPSGSGGRTGGTGGGSGGARPPRSPRKKRNKAKSALIVAVSLLCVMLGALLIVFLSDPSKGENVATRPESEGAEVLQADSGMFYEGVSVDGVEIGNLTYNQAKKKVLEPVNAKLETISYALTLDEQEYTLKSDDIRAAVNVDEVLEEAFKIGRDGSMLQNLDEQNKAKSEGMAFTTQLSFDESALRAKLEDIAKGAYVAPVEPHASVNTEGEDRFKYEAGKSGKEADVDALLLDLQERIGAGELSGTIAIPTLELKPKHTIDEVKQNTKKIDGATTYFKSSAGRKPDRVFNIEKASGIINGAEIAPGEEWSFNEHVGPRTLKGGWKEAPGIVNGNMYEMQAGGGICQVSTTLYNAFLKADLEIVSSKRHSWPSSYVEYGLDATVSTGGPDLVVKNNKEYSVFIFSSVNTKERSITINIYGPNTIGEGIKIELHSKVIEESAPPEPEIIEDPNQPAGYEETIIEARNGYTCEVYRDFVKDGKVQKTEKLYSHKYRTVKGTLRVGTGDMTELEPIPQIPDGQLDQPQVQEQPQEQEQPA